MLAALSTAFAGVAARADGAPNTERQRALVRMVRQDCGSCHGMKLTGGLGPALTREALAERPLEALVATTLYGRPGTPMPGWQSMLSEADARWIAAQLQAGFPGEPGAAR
jgi:cytochrome c55X